MSSGESFRLLVEWLNEHQGAWACHWGVPPVRTGISYSPSDPLTACETLVRGQPCLEDSSIFLFPPRFNTIIKETPHIYTELPKDPVQTPITTIIKKTVTTFLLVFHPKQGDKPLKRTYLLLYPRHLAECIAHSRLKFLLINTGRKEWYFKQGQSTLREGTNIWLLWRLKDTTSPTNSRIFPLPAFQILIMAIIITIDNIFWVTCARHCSKHFKKYILFHLILSTTLRCLAIIMCHVSKKGNWDPETLSNFPKVTQKGSSRDRIWI